MKNEELNIRNEELRMKNRKWLTPMICASLFFILHSSLFISIHAQNGFNMPYSQFGIGMSDFYYDFPLAGRTGGVIYTRSGDNFINPFNPASYAGIGMESFVFDMGADIQITRLQNNDKSVKDADGNLTHLTFGLPITQWWKLAGGLLPYSSVDYSSVSQGVYLDSSVIKTVYDGTGGINMAFIGSAFNILGNGKEGRRLQAGFNINYLTGRIQRAVTYSFSGIDSTHYKPSRRYKETKIGNVTFDLGVQYWEPLNEKYTLGIGLVYKPYRKMDITDKALIYTFFTSDQSLADTIFPAQGESPEFTSTLEQDHTIGIGLSLERNNRWLVAADATFSGWSDMKYTEGVTPPIVGESALMTGPYSRYALGFEKVGVMDASTYWGRISWSAGIHTERGAMRLMIGGQEQVINEWGFGLGATLPMRKGRSLLTLSFGYRSYGNKNLLQRNSISIGISISTCERWFMKRKYN